MTDLTCLFCSEPESCSHLLFRCIVADAIWGEVFRITGLATYPASFEKIAGLWLSESKHEVTNVLHAAVMWLLWKSRNDLCFNKEPWIGLQVIWRR